MRVLNRENRATVRSSFVTLSRCPLCQLHRSLIRRKKEKKRKNDLDYVKIERSAISASIWQVFDVAQLIPHGSLNIDTSFRGNRFIFPDQTTRRSRFSNGILFEKWWRERIVDAKFSTAQYVPNLRPIEREKKYEFISARYLDLHNFERWWNDESRP